MAVVIGQNNNSVKIYRSVNGIDISLDEQMAADLLDQNISSSLKNLQNELKPDGKLYKKSKVEWYWSLGKITNALLLNSKLIPAEAHYFFENVKLRLPQTLSKADRKGNRRHIIYCHRLGTYDESTALTLNWSEWVHLFDSASIKGELRFDVWFNDELEKDSIFFDRVGVRLLARVLNNFFDKLETADLSDDELRRCYDGAKALSGKLKDDSSTDINIKLSNLKQHRILIAQILEAKFCGEELYKVI